MDILELRAHLEACHALSYGWAVSCCHGDRALAEEVLQTVYLKILEGKAQFGGESSFKTWLFGVIRMTAAHERRRQWLRRLKFPRFDEEAERTSHEECLNETMHGSELQTLFKQSLNALPQRQREVLQLVFYHDLTIEGAAEVMGVSVGSARTHYERGKKRFRKLTEGSRIFHESGLGRKEHQGVVSAAKAGG